MVTINTREQLIDFLYGADNIDSNGNTILISLVGVANIGGELLAEAMADRYHSITCFFPYGDEGEEIIVGEGGAVVSDSIYF
jgi:hypothetical protein